MQGSASAVPANSYIGLVFNDAMQVRNALKQIQSSRHGTAAARGIGVISGSASVLGAGAILMHAMI